VVELILVEVFAISNSTCSSVGTHFYAAIEIDQFSLRVAIEFDGGFVQVISLGELTNTLDIVFIDILSADFKALEVVTVGKGGIQGFLLLLLDVDVGILVLFSGVVG
jgi:hypothetical protein